MRWCWRRAKLASDFANALGDNAPLHAVTNHPSFIVGVISDTHGLLRPEAVEALQGSQLIIHAGDVGTPDILEKLVEIAPVRAVRGNVDVGQWADALPITEVVEAGGAILYVLHDVKQLDLKPKAAGFAAVISGHSHKPAQEMRDGVVFLNPGAAGPRRFNLPVSVGRLVITAGQVKPEIMTLNVK